MSDETREQQSLSKENAIDPLILQSAIRRLKSEQNLMLAIVAGGAAALVGASIWAAITAATSFQIGWMAVGVGVLVGYAVRMFGKGVEKLYGFVGAGWSLVGCATGNLLAVLGVISNQRSVPFFSLVEKLNPEIIVNLMQATFNPMDLLFYGIAVYEGFKFSFRQVTEADLMKIS